MTNHLKERIKMFWLLIIISVISFFFLVGCGLGGDAENGQVRGNDGNGQDSSNNAVNDNGTVSHIVDLENRTDNLWDKTEYGEPTGKWFMHNGAGVFGYGMPFGTFRPGDDFSVSLFSHSEGGDEVGRTFRITLTERTNDLQLIETVLEEDVYVEHVSGEEEIFASSFPEKENVIYLLSVEVLNEAEEVEDTLLSLVKVPNDEINATLYTDKEMYEQSDQELTLTVKNDGPTDLVFGVYYTLEKKENDDWEEVVLEMAFIDIAIILAAGEEYKQTIPIESLEKGEYRIFKDVHADGLDISEKLMTSFTVE